MAQKTANQLKQYFLTGSIPTQQQFFDLIESLFNKGDDVLAIEKVTGLFDALAAKASLTQFGNEITNRTNADTALQAAIDAVAGALTGLLDLRAPYNASSNLFPTTGGSGTSGAVVKGDYFPISVAGTLGGQALQPKSAIYALVNTPGQTAGNWGIIVNATDLSNDIGAEPTNMTKGVTPKAVVDYVAEYVSLQFVADAGNETTTSLKYLGQVIYPTLAEGGPDLITIGTRVLNITDPTSALIANSLVPGDILFGGSNSSGRIFKSEVVDVIDLGATLTINITELIGTPVEGDFMSLTHTEFTDKTLITVEEAESRYGVKVSPDGTRFRIVVANDGSLSH